MTTEIRIESYCLDRAQLPQFLCGLSEFAGESEGRYHFKTTTSEEFALVELGERFVRLRLSGATKESNALLGQLVRQILDVNDHVVIDGGWESDDD
jgi:hypothetical protein